MYSGLNSPRRSDSTYYQVYLIQRIAVHTEHQPPFAEHKHKFDAFETKSISESISVNSPGTITQHVAYIFTFAQT